MTNMKFYILLILHDRVVVIRSSLVQSGNLVEVVRHACIDGKINVYNDLFTI